MTPWQAGGAGGVLNDGQVFGGHIHIRRTAAEGVKHPAEEVHALFERKCSRCPSSFSRASFKQEVLNRRQIITGIGEDDVIETGSILTWRARSPNLVSVMRARAPDSCTLAAELLRLGGGGGEHGHQPGLKDAKQGNDELRHIGHRISTRSPLARPICCRALARRWTPD